MSNAPRTNPPPNANLSHDPTRQVAALRQAVLLLAFLVAFAAMGLTLLRGADLMHMALVGLCVLPVSAAVIHHVFRLWFLVLANTIREKKLAREQEEAARKPAGKRHP